MKTKQLPDAVEPAEEKAKTEPWGAQVLRRLHEDSSYLMSDYDDLLGPLENEEVKGYLSAHLAGVEKHMSSIEKLFGKHYKDLPGLEGMMDEKDLTEDEAEEISDDLVEETEDVEEDAIADDAKDMDTMDDDAIDAAGSEGEEEPVPEEAYEGMEEKALSMKRKDASTGTDIGHDGWYALHNGKRVAGPFKTKLEAENAASEYEPSGKSLKNGKHGRRFKALCECGKDPCECEKGKALRNGRSKAACEPGQRSDLTGCTAGEGDTGHAGSGGGGQRFDEPAWNNKSPKDRYALLVEIGWDKEDAKKVARQKVEDMDRGDRADIHKLHKKALTTDELEDVQDDLTEEAADTEEVPEETGEEGKALDDNEKLKVGEAAGFLRDVSQEGSEWADEHRMKSYHYSKVLADIGDRK